MKTPAAYQAAQEEVDKVIGKGPVTVEHMSKLPYITACLRETLRLQPTAPAFSTQPIASTTEWPVLLGSEKYEIMPGQVIVALLPGVHRDPVVFGDDAESFRPDRMLDESFEKLPKNAWKVVPVDIDRKTRTCANLPPSLSAMELGPVLADRLPGRKPSSPLLSSCRTSTSTWKTRVTSSRSSRH